MAERDKTTRNVVVVGGILALLLLLGRKGWSGTSTSSGESGWLGLADAARTRLYIFVGNRSPRGDHYGIGATKEAARGATPVTLMEVVDTVKRAGADAFVSYTGMTIQGDLDTLVEKLGEQGVRVYMPPK
jgi:hypothetical protein